MAATSSTGHPRVRLQLTPERLREVILERSLTMHGLPGVAARIADAARDQNLTFKKLSEELSSDPSLAARVMRVANSSLYRTAEPIDRLSMAVSRLGINTTRNLVIGLSMKMACSDAPAPIQKKMADLWSRSVSVSTISQIVAQRFSRLNPDEAMLAGLMYRIGELPILTLAAETPELMRRPQLLASLIESEQAKVGVLLLRSWRFPPGITEVPINSSDLNRRHDGAPDLSDVVTVARIYAMSDEEREAQQINLQHIPAFSALGIQEAPTETVVMESHAHELQAARALLD